MVAAGAAQDPGVAVDSGMTIAPILNEDRIFGIVPNYATVNDGATAPVIPLTKKQKWSLALRESIDPFNVASAAMGAGMSQWGNETPRYGEGDRAFMKRFGAAMGDFTTQNLFSAGLLASALHQDPRYYRMGPEKSVIKRVGYSVSRLVVARQDSGASAFNASNVFGTMMGIGVSNLYYPAASKTWPVMGGRIFTSFTSGLMGNIISEFWPDLHRILNKHHVPLT